MNHLTTRRQFLQTSATGSVAAMFGRSPLNAKSERVPAYLKGYEAAYGKNPRQAALTWFREAKFGLFLHYGLYSLLEAATSGSSCASESRWPNTPS